MTIVLVLVLGVLGGVITTVAGLGGGLVMVAVLSVVLDPVTALSASAMGLVIGNLHRVWMYRTKLDWRSALPVIVGAVPAAIVAGVLVAWLPEWLIFSLMLMMGSLAVVRTFRKEPFRVPGWAGAPVGILLGTVSATTGGGGLVLAPWLIARGLVDSAYIGTVGVVALCLHFARILGYGWSGGAADGTWLYGLLFALTLPLGNLLGDVLRKGMDLDRQRYVQLAVIAVLLVVAGYGFVQDVFIGDAATAVAGPVR